MSTVHIPILTEPLLEALLEPFRNLPSQAEPHWFVDCTLGGGGHTAAFLNVLKSEPSLRKHKIVAMDQDGEAVAKASERFKSEIAEGRLEILKTKFGDSSPYLKDRPILGLLADLGFSSDQLEDPKRGMSFQVDAPLDMRLDSSQGKSCAELLQTVTEAELEKILWELGEERFAKRIASAIVLSRRTDQLPRTTRELVSIIVRALPSHARHGRIHAATRTFQALRIAVNEELEQLDRLLSDVIVRVRPGGRVAILSFHSLEDRKVKVCFKNSAFFVPLTKKPIQADDVEVESNPRARSAKLRVAERTDGNRGLPC